jgi:PAS domain S-box-containing protein
MEQGGNILNTRNYLTPIAIAVAYIALGALWAELSDLDLPVTGMVRQVVAINKLIFVVVTGLLLYALVTYYTRRIRRAAEAEQEAAATAQAYLTYAAEGILAVDRRGSILQVNPKAELLFGYPEKELVGKPIESLISGRLQDLHVRHRADYFDAPRSRPMGAGLDIAGLRKDGSEFPIEVSLSYVEGNCCGEDNGAVICNITDITERRLLEREARRNEVLGSLGAVAAGIAHEINNPLAIVSSRAELMLTSPDSQQLPEQIRNDLEVVHRNAERASRIAQDMLTLARQRPTARKPVNVNDLVRETLLLFRGAMGRDGVQITTALDSTLQPVIGDGAALGQVLMNLIVNAKDAMPDGGGIRIETGVVPERPEWLRLSVTDTGSGIAPEILPKLFDAFCTTKPRGTGLGLWLSRRTLREHRGTISVQSELGKGTTFTMTLPMIDAASIEHN